MKQDLFCVRGTVVMAVILGLVFCLRHAVSFAQTPAPTDTPTPVPGDASEPDDAPGADPPWIGEGETQNRTFDPEGAVDGLPDDANPMPLPPDVEESP